MLNLSILKLMNSEPDFVMADLPEEDEGNHKRNNVIVGGTPTQRKQKAEGMVIEALLHNQPANAEEISEATGLSKDCARKRMNDLFNRGKAIKVGSRKKSELNKVFYFSLIKDAACLI